MYCLNINCHKNALSIFVYRVFFVVYSMELGHRLKYTKRSSVFERPVVNLHFKFR